MSRESLCSKCQSTVFIPRVKVDSSELYTKLRSEYGPAIFNPQEVEKMLLLSDKDLEDYEAEVFRLRSQIMYINTQRKRLKEHKTKLRSLLSPVRKLPNEILGRIFEHACERNLLQQFPWSEDCSSSPSTTLSSPPITYTPAMSISSVCTRWRSLALSSPGLWSNLRVELSSGGPTSVPPDGFMSTLELYLERSAESPLSLEIDIRMEEDSPSHLAIAALLRHSARWRTFRYSGSHNLDTALPPISESHNHYPILETVEFLDGGDVDGLGCFERAPNLRVLNTYNLIPESKLSWTKLTSVDLVANYGEAGKILDQCPCLVALTLWESASVSVSQCTPPRTAQTIESLSLHLGDDGAKSRMLETVLSSFTLPSLATLDIIADADYVEEPWPRRMFRTFVLRSSCRITSLRLDGVMLSDLDLISILQTLPSLLDLAVNDRNLEQTPITARFISSLNDHSGQASTKSSSPLVPHLRCLTLNVEGDALEFDDAAFIDMVTSRWLPDAAYAAIIGIDCLRSVTVHFRNRVIDKTVWEPLECLDRMGMRVIIIGEE